MNYIGVSGCEGVGHTQGVFSHVLGLFCMQRNFQGSGARILSDFPRYSFFY